ncbi:hypothetical protein HDV04_002628 [Boothiomyces sp. JEL0838]|nr:hypothetical protein HDV04_002628 [Boothiomyces sp. JEL0838]
MVELEKCNIVKRRFKLVVRQEPEYVRACGIGRKDRRMIDPAPILQLVNENNADELEELSSLHPFLVVKTTLWEVDKQHNLKQNKEEDLLGSTVCNATLLRDINKKLGCFFTFADLSVIYKGFYRLEFKLFNLLNGGTLIAGSSECIGRAYSSVFESTSAKDFPGLSSPSELILLFASQGLCMPVRKPKNNYHTPNSIGSNSNGEMDDDD